VLKANRTEFLELSQELLDRGALLRFRATGRSMHPFIKNGSILVVEPFSGLAAKIGDVIFYRRPDGSMTAHRLLKMTGEGNNTVLITKGDSLSYLDPPVPVGQVMGRVIRIEGKSSRLSLTGRAGSLFGSFIARSARGRYTNQGRVVRNLGRLWWLVGGRRLT
jgi:hypothetical protein